MKIFNMPSGPLMVNTYLVIDEKNKEGFIVDPGGYDTGLIEEIRKLETDIKYIILTHGHGDHIGGVKGYRKDMPAAKIVASAAEKDLLADASMNMSMMTQNEVIEIHADILVDEGDELYVGDMKLRFIMTPGHSPGGMCILTGNVLFSGDTLFHSSVGRTDLPGGSFEELSKAIHEKLLILPEDTMVYPGHMGPTSIGFEKQNNPFL